MADFTAVLRKTIDGLGETTPEMRARVYDKARATISAKLAAMNPPPAPAVVERQRKVLEDAIASLEAEYATPPAADAGPEEDLDDVMAQLSKPEGLKPAPAPVLQQPSSPAKPDPAAPRRDAATAAAEKPAPEGLRPAAVTPREVSLPGNVANGNAPAPATARSRGAGGARIAVALIALAFLGSAAYAVWLNRDEVTAMLGMGGEAPVAEAPQQPAETDVTGEAEPAPEEEETAAAEPPAETQPPASEPVDKFTQKLNSDGTETDAGPAGGEDSLGEGTSVAAVTTPPPDASPATPAQPEATPDGEAPAPETAQAPAETAPPADTGQAVAVGQRAIFYEERTSADQQTAEQGNIVWSLVQESPGNDLPPEAAIRGEASIPGKDIQLRMTIRRNADETLPASHIIELIFITPENFDGGAIDNVLRMTMKQTEEATGSPVLGIPAKIGDGFFLIALADGAAEQDTNLQLMRRTRWIDIPVVYRTGRRALITMERGIPGDKVFEDALRDWAAKSG